MTADILNADQGIAGLLTHHLKHLRASGLSDATIIANKLRSEDNKEKVASLLNWKRAGRTIAPALVFPFYGIDGSNGYSRIRPDVPRNDRNGKPVKYESPKGEANRIYLPHGVNEHLQNTAQEMALTEGEKKALALTQELLPTIGLVGIGGWKEKDHQRLLPELQAIAWNGRTVYLIPDSDMSAKPQVESAVAWLAKHLTDRGANVKTVLIPDGPADANGKPTKLGADDYLVMHGKAGMRKLLDEASDPPAIDPDTVRQNAEYADPAKEAAKILEDTKLNGSLRKRFFRGIEYYWSAGRYLELPQSEVEADVTLQLNRGFYNVRRAIVGNVIAQMRAQSIIYGRVEPPGWIGNTKRDWAPEDTFAAENGIVHLPSYFDGADGYLCPATPDYFTMSALDYPFDPKAPTAVRWLEFLNQLWPDDPKSIIELQKWFGYCLVNDTRQQKILGIIGPRRSGKSTIARVQASVIGNNNVCFPTLSSLGGQFGLWPLLDKSLAIFADARLTFKSDQAGIIEQLLSISGEDPRCIDRKCMEPLKNVKLGTRLMLISNELPQLGDSSGALVGRLIILRLRTTFYGQENVDLTAELMAERPGILLWAARGWQLLRGQKAFIQPESGTELVESMEDLSSPISAFVRERCVVRDGCKVSVDHIFAAWKTWCIERNREPGTEQTFGRNLTAALPSIGRSRPREGGTRVRYYEGVALDEEF